MALGLKRRNKDADDFDEANPDATEAVVEEVLENSSKKKNKDDDEGVDYSMTVDWGRKYKPSMAFGSRSIIEAKKVKVARKLMKKVAISAAALMVVLSGASLGASLFVGMSLAKEQAIGAESKQKVEALQPIAQYYDDFVQRQQSASTVLSKDVVWSKIQDQLAAALPSGSKISSESTKYGQVCASPTPFEPSSTIGCVTMEVTVSSYGSLGTLIENLDKSESITDPYVTTTSNTPEGVNASVTFNFDSSVVSTKYAEFLQESAKSGVAPSTTPETPASPAATQ